MIYFGHLKVYKIWNIIRGTLKYHMASNLLSIFSILISIEEVESALLPQIALICRNIFKTVC